MTVGSSLREGTPDSAAMIAGMETSSAGRKGGGVLGLKEGESRGVEGVESPATRERTGMVRLSWEEVSVDDMGVWVVEES